MTYLGRFYQVFQFKVLVIETLGVQILQRVVLIIYKKEENIVQYKVLVVKCWVHPSSC